MRKKLINIVKFFWKWSLLFSIPLCIFIFQWGIKTNSIFQNQVRYISLGTCSIQWASAQAFLFTRNEWRNIIDDRDRRVTDAGIRIDPQHLDSLNSNLPYSGFEYQYGSLRLGQNLFNGVGIRYRGDHRYHWAYPKKSWRLKLNDPYLGNRTWNLIIPKFHQLLNNHFSYILAKEMGLYAPKSQLLSVSVNGSYSGIRLMTEQINEDYLIQNGFANACLYVGDQAGVDRFRGVDDFDLFNENPHLWKCKGACPDFELQPIVALTCALKNLDAIPMDMEMLGRYGAFIQLSQSKHITDHHNWRLIYNFDRKLFVPVVWDPLGWGDRKFYKEEWEAGKIVTNDLIAFCDSSEECRDARLRTLLLFYLVQKEDMLDRLQLEIQNAKLLIEDLDYQMDIDANFTDREGVLIALEQFRDVVIETFDKVEKLELD